MDDLMALARAGVNTINPDCRNSGYLDYVERGTVTWDDNVAWPNSHQTVLEWNLMMSSLSRT